MFDKGYKLLCKIWLVFVSLVLFSGCGILQPPSKSPDGYYIQHYISCGPEAISDALDHYARVNGIKHKRAPSQQEISKAIQDTDSLVDGRAVLTYVFRDFAAITWPHEIKEVCRLYGYEAIELDGIHELQQLDTGIVLLHKKWSTVYHWICVPVESVGNFYGPHNTVILNVYLLRPITR
jgi:hypothetical protein